MIECDVLNIIFILYEKNTSKESRNQQPCQLVRIFPHPTIKIKDNQRYTATIQNPFEENWKKAIVLEELLTNDHHREGGHSEHPSPRSHMFNRSNYENWASHLKLVREEEGPWDNNEDNQISKLHKMFEGLSRWEEHFQDFNIGKLMTKIDKRSKVKL